MQKDALALILLLAVMALGMLGAALWLSGSNRRAALAARGREDGGGSAVRAALERIDAAAAAHEQGAAARAVAALLGRAAVAGRLRRDRGRRRLRWRGWC